MRKPIAERLMAKVVKSDGCWLWTGARLPNGYGRMSAPGGNKLTHRVAYEVLVGPIPMGLYVLHKCDVRNCVNPEHLFVGTANDNVQDCMKKSRRITMRGVMHGRAKLTAAIVALIRVSPLTIGELAKIFEVDPKVITNARDGTTWGHVNASSFT